MTWKEFKEAIERLGVKDNCEIEFIDWHDGEDPNLWDKGYNDKGILVVSIT